MRLVDDKAVQAVALFQVRELALQPAGIGQPLRRNVEELDLGHGRHEVIHHFLQGFGKGDGGECVGQGGKKGKGGKKGRRERERD